MVAAVATLEPAQAANMAHEAMLLWIRPPGMNTSQRDMTAFEVGKRIEEFIRNALPLFEPMETDYNGALMLQDFYLLQRGGAFGPESAMPESLRSDGIEFEFESPLNEAQDRILGQKLLEAKGIAVEMEPLDPLAIKRINWRKAQKDALHGIGTPADWLVEDADLDKMEEQAQAAQQAQELAETVAIGAQVAQQVAGADQMMAEADTAQQTAEQGAAVI
jgi:bacterioferritin-associated ferredoxin